MTPREMAYEALDRARSALDADSDEGDTTLEHVAAHLVDVARTCSNARDASAIASQPRCICCDEVGHVSPGRSVCEHCLEELPAARLVSAIVAYGVAS